VYWDVFPQFCSAPIVLSIAEFRQYSHHFFPFGGIKSTVGKIERAFLSGGTQRANAL
jgi:hypothetical protein